MAPNYHIGSKLKETAAHHESFEQLWKTKWKEPAEMGVYPFMFGAVQDFQPIVDELVQKGLHEPYNWDEYAQVFFPKAEELVARAEKAEGAGEQEKASELYLRAGAVYRIARFPIPRSEKQKLAWERNKVVARKGLSIAKHPVQEVNVPHIHAIVDEGSTIPIYYQVPDPASASSPVPAVIIVTGGDGYRTELAIWAEGWRQLGVALLVVEIPGTGDSPARSDDPTSMERIWSSLFDWIKKQSELDSKKLIVWGFSTGGYYAIRVAHTHKNNLLGSVALGGGAHHMFDPEWIDEINHLEYPFDAAGLLCKKFGYGDDIEKFKKEGHKFSLLNDGTLDTPCSNLLLVNGTEDEIFPIDDYLLVLEHGDPKEARFVQGRKHMGEPESFKICLSWIYKQFGIEGDVMNQLRTLPTKTKY